MRQGPAARFVVPPRAQDVWLMSATTRPCDVIDSGDDRLLGVCISRLTMDDGFDMRRIDFADPLLSEGFHVSEDGHRWTDGHARLPAALWTDCEDGFFLRVDLAGPSLPRWVAPPVVGYDRERSAA